jgi:predicted nuclease of predicted toxin-antitoxin system
MAGLGIRLLTDEDVSPRLAAELRLRGYDAISVRDVRRINQRLSDEDQLDYATAEERALLVFNVRDYYLLADAWARAGRQHAGIIMTSQSNDIGALLRRVEWHLDNYEPAQQGDVVLWLAEPPPEP